MVNRYDPGCLYAGEYDMVRRDDGTFVTYEDYAALKMAAEKAIAVLEDYEVQIDGEWGACRSIDRLYADGMVNDVLPLLKGLLRD